MVAGYLGLYQLSTGMIVEWRASVMVGVRGCVWAMRLSWEMIREKPWVAEAKGVDLGKGSVFLISGHGL